jgi:uncharacterized damage-inducible protein DinB
MLTKITLETLEQLLCVVEQLDNRTYSTRLEILNGSSIGKHVRHVLEFYICLQDGIQKGEVNYDNRVRNLQLEESPDYAQMVLNHMIDTFNNVALNEKNIQHIICFGDEEISSESSISRELVYLIEHSIHHYAIIGIALKNELPQLVIPTNFGIAYSTVQHAQGNQKISVKA